MEKPVVTEVVDLSAEPVFSAASGNGNNGNGKGSNWNNGVNHEWDNGNGQRTDWNGNRGRGN